MHDFDKDGNALPGLCSRLADDDNDGLPQDCDRCPSIADRTNADANVSIEDERAQSQLGNACDPVPQVDHQVTRARVLIIPQQGIGREGADWVKVETETVLGDDGTLTQPSAFDQPLSFRHCSCYDAQGGKLTEALCLSLTDCSPSRARFNGGAWRTITPTTVSDGTPAPIDVSFDTAQSTHVDWVWNWLAEAEAGVIESQGSSPIETNGLVATIVEHDTSTFASARDDDGADYLRTVVHLVSTPNYVRYNPADGLTLRCAVPRCLPWLPDLRYIYEPWEWIDEVSQPAPFISDGSRLVLLHNESPANITSRFDPKITELLASGGWAFLPPVESSETLESAGITTVGVLVPREGSGFSRPVRVTDKDGMLVLQDEPVADQFGTSVSVLSNKGSAAFLATEEAVYFIGGAELSSLTWLRRFSFDRGFTTTITDLSAVQSEVDGMAVDPLRNTAYVLFIDRGESVSQARLAAVDLGTGASADLLKVPYGSQNHAVGVSLGLHGEVVVVANRDNGVEGWMYDVAMDGALNYVGSWKTTGSLLDAPHPSRALVVTTTSDEFQVFSLQRDDFKLSDTLVEL